MCMKYEENARRRAHTRLLYQENEDFVFEFISRIFKFVYVRIPVINVNQYVLTDCRQIYRVILVLGRY